MKLALDRNIARRVKFGGQFCAVAADDSMQACRRNQCVSDDRADRSGRARPTPPKISPRPCRGIREAAARGAQIICLEELFRSQYFCREENHDYFELAEPIPGPIDGSARQAGARTWRGDRSPRCSSGAPPGLYHNTAAIIDADGSLLGIYRKMHIPDDPLYYEKFYFTPGDLGLSQLRHAIRAHRRAGLLGPVVSGGRAAGQPARRANSFLSDGDRLASRREKQEYGAAQLDAWRTIQRAHAIANGVFVAAVNRVGFEGPPDSGIEFWGSSFVADPFGQVIAEASTDKEEI